MTSKAATRPVIFGEVLFDQFVDGNAVLGGAPFNVAWHLQAFGQSPLLISRVGDDPLGRQIRATMLEWGMDTAGLQLDSAHPTGVVNVCLEHGEPRFDIVDGRAYDYISSDAIPPLPERTLLYHGSLALRNQVSREACQRLCSVMQAPIFLDVNLRPPWWQRQNVLDAVGRAKWVKLNEDELRLLVPGHGDLQEAAKKLLNEYKLEYVILTRGAAGAFVLTVTGECQAVKPQLALNICDTVGAGDAFSSVCILGLLQGWPLALSMERAQSFATAIVGVQGATVSDRSFYQPFLTSWGLG